MLLINKENEWPLIFSQLKGIVCNVNIVLYLTFPLITFLLTPLLVMKDYTVQ